VVRRLYRLMLGIFGRLPRSVRRFAIRRMTPSFRVGAMCFVQRDDGALLFVRHAYRRNWGVPGGLLHRGEEPAAAARREAHEEIGVDVQLAADPVVIFDARARRIDVVYACRLAGSDSEAIRPASAEILEARWFPRQELPDLQVETRNALRRLVLPPS